MPRGIAQTARIREQRRRARREQVEDVGLIVHDQQRRPLRPDRRVVCERALRRRNCPRFIYPVVRIGLPDFSGWRHGMCAFKKDDSIYHGASRTSTSLAVADVRPIADLIAALSPPVLTPDDLDSLEQFFNRPERIPAGLRGSAAPAAPQPRVGPGADVRVPG
ncbi:hypothetical protein G6F65_019127 [Rhizopus arrhizus]|nr:hypothetical protein G6F65_019127 [Rhizopus arrhizus]